MDGQGGPSPSNNNSTTLTKMTVCACRILCCTFVFGIPSLCDCPCLPGTFWMSLEDFATRFTDVYLCDIIPNRYSHVKTRGEWIKGKSAGGCMNYRESWPNNPKFKVTVSTATEVSLMILQEAARLLKGEACNEYKNSIGCAANDSCVFATRQLSNASQRCDLYIGTRCTKARMVSRKRS